MRAIEESLSMVHEVLQTVIEVQQEEGAERQNDQRKEGASRAQAESDAVKRALKERRQHLKRLSESAPPRLFSLPDTARAQVSVASYVRIGQASSLTHHCRDAIAHACRGRVSCRLFFRRPSFAA